MAKVCVLAYYYSADDIAKINLHLDELARSESYLFGDIDTTNIPLLRNEGILMDILNIDPADSGAIPRSIRSPSEFGSRTVSHELMATDTKIDTPILSIKL